MSHAAITTKPLAKTLSAIVGLDDVDLDRRAAALRLCPGAFRPGPGADRKQPHISGAAPPRCVINPSAQLST
jgi:hypothetical protein